MSWKTIVVLVVLIAGLGGFFYYDTYWWNPAREKAESAKGRLWTVEPKDVEAVTIKRQSDTIQLKRVEGGWDMLEPVKTRADRGTVDDVVTSLVTVRADREIDPNPAKPADFGLDPAAAELRLQVKGRKDPLVLAVGTKSPTGAWVYAREAGKPAVVTVSELVGRDTSRPVADFRDKTVIAFDRKEVNGVDLDVGGERISLAAEDGGKWRIVTPTAYRADSDQVGDFLEKLGSAKVKEFVADSPASLGPYGLDRPAKVTLWIGKDKERSSKALLLGRADSDKKGVYVMRAGEPGVMLAPDELWTALPKTVAALRDKVVVAYAYDKVNRVELDSGRGHVTVERDGPGWKITAPEPLKADNGTVNALLWSIRDLRATGFLSDAATDIPKFVKKPEVTVKLWEEGAKEPKTLLVESSRDTRGGRPAAVAAVQGQGPVTLVDARILQDLSKTETDLRDKSLFPVFETSDIRRARLASAGKPVVVEKSGEDWKVLEPSRGPAKGDKVSDLLFTLRSLRWKQIVSPKGDDAPRYGLDRPELEVSLYKADNAEVATLQVGKQEGDVSYVRLKSGPTIYAVEDKLLGDLRKAPSNIPG
ncbi:MAG TPA: DUF4340 domain-containing protein [Methylomirabilota bacterium]|jgi:hypothetical protein|nr:DUF4340 domain-containing protein [Methylomirabilota bacterium]